MQAQEDMQTQHRLSLLDLTDTEKENQPEFTH